MAKPFPGLDTPLVDPNSGLMQQTYYEYFQSRPNFPLSVTNGGTGDTGTAWASYTPTVTASSGTFTTVSATGRFKTIGKTVFVQFTVTITTVGTASGLVIASLPATAAGGSYNLSGNTGGGFQLTAAVGAGTNLCTIAKYDGTSAISAGAVLNATGVYEAT